MSTVTFIDESLPGARTEIGSVDFPTTTVSARDLIVRRIAQDVAEHNAGRRQAAAHSLVTPTAVERELNGALRPDGEEHPVTGLLDEDGLREAALAAFATNGFFLFVGDRQLTALDEQAQIGLDTEVVFIKLMPLVGG